MLVIETAVALLGAAFVVATALSFVRARKWWVRMFEFPRAQIVFASIVVLGLLAFVNLRAGDQQVWEWILFGLLCVAVIAQLASILPYTRLWKQKVPTAPPDVPADRRLRLVISNVQQGNRNFTLWLEKVQVEDPDVIVAVEPDEAWDRALQFLAAHYPHHVRLPQDNTYGLVLYSRCPLHHVKIKHLMEADVPSIFTSLELPSGHHVRLVVVHPRPPRPDIQQDSVLRDGELVRAGRIARSFSIPAIVVGDLNDVAWSPTTRLFLRIARMLDPRIGRGRFSTYHASHPLLRYPLDHVFHTNHFDLVELRRLGHVGSDHFPILVELALRLQDAGRPDAAELEEDDEDRMIDAVQDAQELLQNETGAERRERKLADQ
jgi:endonuclease/exonuclease/phosphatase (EEP) superfamily protein YafD